jgi:Fur family iron response transcriptional regulator
MTTVRPFSRALDRLSAVGLRPTRQRLALARLLFDSGDRHVTAEQLHQQAVNGGVKVSLATVYNTLNQFTASGLLREVAVDARRSYFDTNTDLHHHFFNQDTAELTDISGDAVAVSHLPAPPDGTVIDGVDVIIRVRRN